VREEDMSSRFLDTNDVLQLVISVALIAFGLLMVNVAFGVTAVTTSVFQNMSSDASLVPVTTLTGAAQTLFQFLSIVIIAAGAALIISVLLKAIRGTTTG
jgi:hypothetical protein